MSSFAKAATIRGGATPRRTDVRPFRGTRKSESAIKLLQEIENRNKDREDVYVICDNAKYYKSSAVKEHLEDSRLKLLFLPPYSPNLNLIERLWRILKKTVSENRYYEVFDDFQKALIKFMENKSERRKAEYACLMTEKFHISSQPEFLNFNLENVG